MVGKSASLIQFAFNAHWHCAQKLHVAFQMCRSHVGFISCTARCDKEKELHWCADLGLGDCWCWNCWLSFSALSSKGEYRALQRVCQCLVSRMWDFRKAFVMDRLCNCLWMPCKISLTRCRWHPQFSLPCRALRKPSADEWLWLVLFNERNSVCEQRHQAKPTQVCGLADGNNWCAHTTDAGRAKNLATGAKFSSAR